MQSRLADQATARKLRKKGYTLPEIADEVKAGKGLVSLWVRDVEISEAGKKRLAKNCRKSEGAARGRKTWSVKCKNIRERYREEGRLAAQKGEVLHALACGLYWGEGSKTRCTADLTNSDPHIIKKFIEFCRVYFGTKNEELSFMVSAYTTDFTPEEIVSYWVKTLEIEGADQRKHQFDPSYPSKGKGAGGRTGKYPYGTCKITVKKSTQIIQHIYGALEVYGGIVLDPAPLTPTQRKLKKVVAI